MIVLRLTLLLIVTLAIAAGPVLATTINTADQFGLGVILGEPTGFSGKYFLNETFAIDGALAWSFSDDSALVMHADYLFNNFSMFNPSKGALGLYFGLGGQLEFATDTTMGLRIPIGLSYIVGGMPMDIFAEFVPIMDIVPSTDFRPTAAFGIRYFFGPMGNQY